MDIFHLKWNRNPDLPFYKLDNRIEAETPNLYQASMRKIAVAMRLSKPRKLRQIATSDAYQVVRDRL